MARLSGASLSLAVAAAAVASFTGAAAAADAALQQLAAPSPVVIDNLSPRLDSSGRIMDAHDFSLRRYEMADGPWYYLTSVQYGGCEEPARYGCDMTPVRCGFQLNHTVGVWRSRTLASGSWEFVTTAITPDQRPAGTLFRPDAIWNPNTNRTVLWWNYVYPNGTYAGCAAATAPGPAGPFTLAVPLVNTTEKGGDFHLFSDDDEGRTGYVIYGANFSVHIQRLTPDYLGVAAPGEIVTLPPYFVEAPALLKRGGVYYAVTGHCCCFCEQGSGAMVFTAPSPMGPWTQQAGGDIACIPTTDDGAGHPLAALAAVGGVPTPNQGCQYADPATTSAVRSQQSFISEVRTPQGTAWLWAGDRWQQSPDGTKGHDPQFWAPLQWAPNPAGSGPDVILPLRWVDNFTLTAV